VIDLLTEESDQPFNPFLDNDPLTEEFLRTMRARRELARAERLTATEAAARVGGLGASYDEIAAAARTLLDDLRRISEEGDARQRAIISTENRPVDANGRRARWWDDVTEPINGCGCPRCEDLRDSAGAW
jgi:hypothetical protein